MERFRHKIVVISGASSGIGAAAARRFAAEGATVVLASRNEGKLRQLADSLTGGAVLIAPCRRFTLLRRRYAKHHSASIPGRNR